MILYHWQEVPAHGHSALEDLRQFLGLGASESLAYLNSFGDEIVVQDGQPVSLNTLAARELSPWPDPALPNWRPPCLV